MDNTPIPSPPEPDARRTLVVLVGRTNAHGLDSALRTDSSLELVRSRSPLGALGELAEAHRDHRDADLTVVLAPDLLPSERSSAFAQAARHISQRTRLLQMGTLAPEGFDGCVPAGLDALDTCRMIRHPREEGESPADVIDDLLEAYSEDEPAIPSPCTNSHQPLPASFTPAAGPKKPSTTDHNLLPAVALATGRDPVEAVLAGIKLRLGAESVSLVPQAANPEPGALASAVIFAGRELGLLSVNMAPDRRPPAQDLIAQSAAELAPWVALAVQQEQLRHAAFTDDLTGAWNRRYFTRFLAEAIRQATLRRHTVTLLVFDIDNFKQYNDQFSHAAGDVILTETVRMLNACIRATDRVCRIGGDEFAVIFHDPEGPRGPLGGPTSPQSISEIVRRFQSQILQHRFPKLLELAPGTLTISGGMATFPWDGRTVSQLLDKADSLAIQSKRQGKNHITLGPGAEQVCGK